MNPILSAFSDLSYAQKFRKPRTRLERVLKEYATAGSGRVLDIVIDNFQTFRAAGLLEQAFLDAWSTNKHGTPNWSIEFCDSVFNCLDPKRLLEAGDPLPDGDPLTVYRGVAGTGESERRVRGYSWTGDESIARLFAEIRRGCGLASPAMYRATIRRQDVLAYLNESGRNEQEFLIRPRDLNDITLVEELSHSPERAA